MNELKDGFYWYMAFHRRESIFSAIWKVIQILDGRVLYCGNDMEFEQEDLSGLLVTIPEPSDSEPRITMSKRVVTEANTFNAEQIEEMFKQFARILVIGNFLRGEIHKQEVARNDDGSVTVFTTLTRET